MNRGWLSWGGDVSVEPGCDLLWTWTLPNWGMEIDLNVRRVWHLSLPRWREAIHAGRPPGIVPATLENEADATLENEATGP